MAPVSSGAGFIGSHLCARLAAAGMQVHSTSRRASAGEVPWRHWSLDLSELAAVDRLLAEVRPDAVFHLASMCRAHPT